MAQGPLVLLSAAAGQTFIETGLVVLRHTHNRLFSGHTDQTDREILNNIAIHHEWVHYVQSITSASTHYAGQEMLRLAGEIVVSAAKGEALGSLQESFSQLSESLYGRRADESFRFVDMDGGTIFVPLPDSYQLGLLDLLEGVAVLESYKLCMENAQVDDFLRFRDICFPGTAKNVYRWSFNWLASDIGLEAAYELLGPVSFFALQTDDPAREFIRISTLLSQEKDLDYKALTDIKVLSEFTHPRGWTSWLQNFEHGEPESGHVTLDPCTAYATTRLGVDMTTQLGAIPSQVTPESFEALRPPVIAYSGIDAVTFEIAVFARENHLAETILDWTSVVGAAERLTILAETEVYQFCPHKLECPHFESALCHKNFAPPGVLRSYDQCRFPNTLHKMISLAPSALWKAVGRERKSIRELVEAFEATGEAGLWALARRQRASIIQWRGKDGYDDLEWKCKLVADKALRALSTGRIEDLIEARAFRDAVVKEIRDLAGTKKGDEGS